MKKTSFPKCSWAAVPVFVWTAQKRKNFTSVKFSLHIVKYNRRSQYDATHVIFKEMMKNTDAYFFIINTESDE